MYRFTVQKRSKVYRFTVHGVYRFTVENFCFGANEKLTMSARIELTPLETVMGTRGNAEGPSSSAPVGALARRVVRGGNIIHAEGVPQ